MIKFDTLHKKWMKDPAYRKEYDALEEEFALMAAVAKARADKDAAEMRWLELAEMVEGMA